MKTFVAAMIGFVLIIIGTFVYIHFITESIIDLDNLVDDIIMHAESEKWEETQLALNKFLSEWQSAKKWFAVFIHHEEMDNINESLYKLEVYVQFHDKMETIVNANVLKILLQHIPESEKFTLENVLKLLPNLPPQNSIKKQVLNCAFFHSI